MNWDDARIFLAVAREGSFSKAAKKLGVQHSTVSRRIRMLEEKLATSLVERKLTGFSLTEAGMELEHSARRIEREVLAIEGVIGGQSDDVAGELRVTAIANMASTVLMPIFARFSIANPKIELNLQVTNNNLHLAKRDADVALRQTNTPLDTLIGTRLTIVASAVYGSVEYCAALRAGRIEEKWIGVECCEYHRDWTKQARPRTHHEFCSDDMLLTVAAMKDGLGVAYLPCFLGDSDPVLTRFRQPEKKHDLGLWLLYHRDLRNNKRVILFREHMRREIRGAVALFEGTTPTSK
jgi:DNA-binding transcriptional LysR family regulator